MVIKDLILYLAQSPRLVVDLAQRILQMAELEDRAEAEVTPEQVVQERQIKAEQVEMAHKAQIKAQAAAVVHQQSVRLAQAQRVAMVAMALQHLLQDHQLHLI